MRDGGETQHVFYTRLVNDVTTYGIGLAKLDRTLARLSALLESPRGGVRYSQLEGHGNRP